MLGMILLRILKLSDWVHSSTDLGLMSCIVFQENVLNQYSNFSHKLVLLSIFNVDNRTLDFMYLFCILRVSI